MSAPRNKMFQQKKQRKTEEDRARLEQCVPEMNKVYLSYADRFAEKSRKLLEGVQELIALENEMKDELEKVGGDGWEKVFTKSFQPYQSIEDQKETSDDVEGPALEDVEEMAAEMVKIAVAAQSDSK